MSVEFGELSERKIKKNKIKLEDFGSKSDKLTLIKTLINSFLIS